MKPCYNERNLINRLTVSFSIIRGDIFHYFIFVLFAMKLRIILNCKLVFKTHITGHDSSKSMDLAC